MTQVHQNSHCAHGHDGVSATAVEVADGTIWTCPMHPEIRRNGPGQCPICGMALEPLEPGGDRRFRRVVHPGIALDTIPW